MSHYFDHKTGRFIEGTAPALGTPRLLKGAQDTLKAVDKLKSAPKKKKARK